MKQLNRVSAVLAVLAWLTAVAGAILGIAVAVETRTDLNTDVLGNPTTSTSHPYVALGIGIIIAGVVWALPIYWMAALGRAYVETHDELPVGRPLNPRPTHQSYIDQDGM